MLSPLFNYPVSVPELAAHEIHIWCAALNQSIARVQMLPRTLPVDELLRAERFHFEKDRKSFIITRGILRMILGSYLGAEPNRLRFYYGKYGKPALADTFGKKTIHFNLSHSNGVALFAFTRDCEIGVDVEEMREIEDLDQIAGRFFSEGENKVFCGLPEDKKKEAFFNCWTRKEAFMKACGDGLSRSLDKFEVSLVPGGPAQLLEMEGNSREAARWSIQDLRPAHNYVGAVAVKAHMFETKHWRW